MISKLPTIKIYIPQGKINSKTGNVIIKEKQYAGKMTGKHIGEFISENISFFCSALCDEKYYDFLSENLNKVMLFKNKENIPLNFKGLSSKFRGNLEFATVQNDCKNITERFSITEFPTIIVIEGKESVTYAGKHEFIEISSFLKQYSSKNKILIKISEESESDIISDSLKDETKPINKAKIFKANEFKDEIGNMEGIVITMFYEDNIHDWWNYAFTFYQEIAIFVSVKCITKKEREICSSYGAKSFPTIRLFPANKEKKATNLK